MRVAAVVGAQAIVIFSPLWIAPDATRFHLFVTQLTRSGRGGVQRGSFIDQAIDRFSILFEPQTNYFPIGPLALAIALNLAWMWSRGWRPNLERPLGDHLSAQFVLVALAMLAFVPHLVFSRGFLTYFVTSSALLVPAIAIGVARGTPDGARSPPFVLSIAASLLTLSLITVPFHWSSWVGSGESSFLAFRKVGRELRDLAGPDCTILTMETALALETGCHVLPGLEYSIFSYFPMRAKKEVEKRGVLNAELLKQRVLELQPELIALGPIGFASLRRGHKKSELPHRDSRNEPPSLSFLISGGYTYYKTYRISSGARLRRMRDTVGVATFLRNDLLPGPGE
jgi:hypothetical protein